MATNNTLLLRLLCISIVCVTANNDDMPTVHESWIFAMITFGFIGSIALIFLITVAVFKTYERYGYIFQTKDDDRWKIAVNIALTFAIWIFNAIACLEWAFLRTDLFIELTPTKCTIIYISNYLFYMFSKFCLHLLLLYRLYLAFHGTALKVNSTLLRIFAVIITIDFIVFVSLWLDICLQKVSVGIILPSESLTFCTLYNNSSASQMTLYETIWPTLFGTQDFIVGILTLSIFIYKLSQLSRVRHDPGLEALVRKLFTMGTSSIVSTFLLFTFAVPFYSNLTFLLPLDALINSLCVLLLLDWTNRVYLKLCCAMDSCLQSAFKHENSKSNDNSVVIPQSPHSPQFVLHKLDVPNLTIHMQCSSAPIGTHATSASPPPQLKDVASFSHEIKAPFATHNTTEAADSVHVTKQTKTGTDGQTISKSLNPAVRLGDSRFSKSAFF